MGGILKNEGRYVEAIAKLQSASQASKLFPSVQHAIETALVECWKGCQLSAPGVSGGGGDDDERRRRRRKEVVESSVRMVFNPRIHPLMTVEETDAVLWGAFSVEGGGGGDGGGCDGGDSGDSVTVRWPHGSNHTQPFYFALTFPLQTYAIEGIEVETVLSLHSNLSIPIELLGVRAVTNVTMLDVPLTEPNGGDGSTSKRSLTLSQSATRRHWWIMSIERLRAVISSSVSFVMVVVVVVPASCLRDFLWVLPTSPSMVRGGGGDRIDSSPVVGGE